MHYVCIPRHRLSLSIFLVFSLALGFISSLFSISLIFLPLVLLYGNMSSFLYASILNYFSASIPPSTPRFLFRCLSSSYSILQSLSPFLFLPCKFFCFTSFPAIFLVFLSSQKLPFLLMNIYFIYISIFIYGRRKKNQTTSSGIFTLVTFSPFFSFPLVPFFHFAPEGMPFAIFFIFSLSFSLRFPLFFPESISTSSSLSSPCTIPSFVGQTSTASCLSSFVQEPRNKDDEKKERRETKENWNRRRVDMIYYQDMYCSLTRKNGWETTFTLFWYFFFVYSVLNPTSLSTMCITHRGKNEYAQKIFSWGYFINWILFSRSLNSLSSHWKRRYHELDRNSDKFEIEPKILQNQQSVCYIPTFMVIYLSSIIILSQSVTIQLV